jgi:hypothetical protein
MSAAASVNIRGAHDAYITGNSRITQSTPLNQLFYSMIQPVPSNVFDQYRGQARTQKMTTKLYYESRTWYKR